MYRKHWQTAVALGFILASGLLFGLAVGRWLAENLYLASPLLLHWLPSAMISVAAMASLLFLSALALKRGRSIASLLAMASCCLPLSLLAIYVLSREVNTVRGSVLVPGSLILVAALSVARVARTRWRERGTLVVAFVLPLAVYLATLAPTVGQHDTFEFQVLSHQLGIAHPTGYPLYIMLGKLFTFLPLGNVAYRVNLSSAVFAAASVALLYATIKLLTGDRWASLLAALSFGFGCAFWSQAVEAEVYALNALFVCTLCYLLIRVSLGARANPAASTRTTEDHTSNTGCTCLRHFSKRQRMVLLAAFVFGLSLTHHRTILLLAPAILAYAIANRGWQMFNVGHLATLATAFLSPLLTIHLYIPVRWWQIHGQSMGWQQFADLVLGRQFAAALTWTALLDDPHRPMILARSLVEQYPPPALALAAVGILCLLGRRAQQRAYGGCREALFLLLAFAAYALFGLSYYVPDVSLFLIPAFAFIAVGLGIGASAMRRAVERGMHLRETGATSSGAAEFAGAFAVTAVALVPLSLICVNLPAVDRSDARSWHEWGSYVLQQDLASGSIILADSEKMAPLYYLQRVEQVRPDTETGVFADEESNRLEIRRHLDTGNHVYLARFLPGLENTYHLRSLGPLVEISTHPLAEPPPQLEPVDLSLGDGVTLLGYELDSQQVERLDPVRLTLFWKADGTSHRDNEVRLRLVGPSGQVWMETKGRVPVNGLYPMGAWRPGEIVPDFHEMQISGLLPPGTYSLQVGLFTPAGQRTEHGPRGEAASGYVPLGEIHVHGSMLAAPSITYPLRASFGDHTMLLGYDMPSVAWPGAQLTPTLYWQAIGDTADDYLVSLQLVDQSGEVLWQTAEPPLLGEYPPFAWRPGDVLVDRHSVTVPERAHGPLRLYVGLQETISGRSVPALNGWLSSATTRVPLTDLKVEKPPAPRTDVDYLPANFENLVSLLDYEIHNPQVQRGGALHLSLTWQGTSSMDEDYTVFVHILDDSDRIWGQADIQPVYGTYPTSRWQEGEVVVDPHVIWTDPEAPLGLYRIQVGLYLLRTMERLTLLDDSGRPLGNRLTIDLMEMVP